MSKKTNPLVPWYVRLAYDPASLPFLCHFGHEQLRMAEQNSWLTKRAVIRITLICLCISLMAGWFVFHPWQNFWSDWAFCGLVVQVVSLFVCFLMPFDLNYKRNYAMMAVNHLLMTISVLFHTLFLFVFWTVLWDDVFRKSRGFPGRVEY